MINFFSDGEITEHISAHSITSEKTFFSNENYDYFLPFNFYWTTTDIIQTGYMGERCIVLHR